MTQPALYPTMHVMQTVNVGQGGRAKRPRMPRHAMYVQCSGSALPHYDKVFASSLRFFLYRVVTRLVIFYGC